MHISKLEKSIGIEVYGTKSLGIGGVIKQQVDDFIVEEILVDGSKASVATGPEKRALGSTEAKDHYLLCVLTKRNWDTFSAVNAIAKQLHLVPDQISFAGIKDTKAFTGQHITIEGVSTEGLVKVSVKGITLAAVGYFHDRLTSFYSYGNHFQVIIREIGHSKPAICRRIKQIINELQIMGGIPNFFGHQRFGTVRPITHLVGKAIIAGDFKKAAMLFLAKPSLHEHQASRDARQRLLETNDFSRALHDFPRSLCYERLMLRHLERRPDDFAGSFRTLPSKLRLLFPQAYQAYLFNRFLSKRLENDVSLNKAYPGDYVVGMDRLGLPLVSINRIVTENSLNEVNIKIEEEKMHIALPLVGSVQPLSKGFQGDLERQVIEEEDISEPKYKNRLLPEISVKGGLRPALAALKCFEPSLICGGSLVSSRNQAKVAFTLSRGSYATVLLRELMKPNDPMESGF